MARPTDLSGATTLGAKPGVFPLRSRGDVFAYSFQGGEASGIPSIAIPLWSPPTWATGS